MYSNISLLIPSHRIADRIVDIINHILDLLGLEHQQVIQEIVYIVFIVAIGLTAGWLVRLFLVWVIRKLLEVRDSKLGREVIRQRLITRCSHMIPPLIFLSLIPVAFDADPHTLNVLERLVLVYALIATGMALNAIIGFVWNRYDEQENTKNHPLRGILNVTQGLVWIVVVIVAISILLDKSPAYLLTGLGAFAAALMLIFKDSILGFVAGIQLSQNDMLRVGDWITVPSTIANGVVIDVTLTVVKVQNWDNTIVMLPPYTLVSTSFQNWRGMWDSGCRRIARQIYIDNSTIRRLEAGEADAIAKQFPALQGFVANNKGTVYDPGKFVVNGTVDTNLGLFRAYLCLYLGQHPEISKESQLLIRLMEPVEQGTPLQIYCFTATTKWTAYEAIQSEIFEHIAAVAPKFGLMIFNEADGSDLIVHQGAPVKAGPPPGPIAS